MQKHGVKTLNRIINVKTLNRIIIIIIIIIIIVVVIKTKIITKGHAVKNVRKVKGSGYNLK